MKGFWRGVLPTTFLALMACQGDLPGDATNPGNNPSGTTQDQWAPCTDPAKCCSKEAMRCDGDPDRGIVCTCAALWDCSKNPNKCAQKMPTPDGGTDWECTWNEFKYSCTKKGTKENPPPTGSSGWTCTWNETEFKWECTTATPPNPVNKPGGSAVWKCTVDVVGGTKSLVCERTTTSTAPPTGGGMWECNGDVCVKKDENGGLPTGGSKWTCHKSVVNGAATWDCTGESTSPPGGGGWVCVKKEEFGVNMWLCEKKETPTDFPPGGGWWSCVKGTEFGGTKCTKVAQQPEAPTPEAKPGQKCKINEKMWCDGLDYCGWGMVMCDQATGTWQTKVVNGKVMLNCSEKLANGKVPNTVCACFHYFFNPMCCEAPDCLVPTGTDGQICPKSGGKLCDYCNPLKPECTETNAKCVVTNAHETFCGRDCSAAACPAGYLCLPAKGGTNQCVPADFSCYR